MVASLLDEIRAEEAARKQNRCPIGKILRDLDEKARGELAAALADSLFTNVAIANVLNRRGYAVTPTGKSIGAHRRGVCGCQR